MAWGKGESARFDAGVIGFMEPGQSLMFGTSCSPPSCNQVMSRLKSSYYPQHFCSALFIPGGSLKSLQS